MADIQPLFPAAYFDGLSAKEYPALFSAVPGTDTVRIFPAEDGRDGEPLCEDWPLGASAIISGSLAYAAKGDPVHLRREPDDGQRLVLRRPESIAAMQRLYRVPAKKKAGKTFNAWIWGTVAVWIFFIAVYLAGPTLFRVGAELVPQSVEESMGKSSQKMILQALSLMDGVEGVNYLASDSEELKKLMDRLVRAGDTRLHL